MTRARPKLTPELLASAKQLEIFAPASSDERPPVPVAAEGSTRRGLPADEPITLALLARYGCRPSLMLPEGRIRWGYLLGLPHDVLERTADETTKNDLRNELRDNQSERAKQVAAPALPDRVLAVEAEVRW